MAEVGQTNTYDSDVDWHFHESYYLKKCTVKGYRVTKKTENSSGTEQYNYAVDAYLFRRDEFGSNTYEYVSSFASHFDYALFNSDYGIIVYDEHFRYLDNDTPVHNSDLNVGDVFFYLKDMPYSNNMVDVANTTLKFYEDNAKWPGLNYIWEGEENVDPTPEPTPEPTTTPNDPSGDDPGTEIDNGDHVDIDSIDDASEILREIYKQDTDYYRDLLEVQQNAFDFQVVHVSLMFCSVFLCGILVGCAFARSLWHKMNAG